MPRNRIFVDTSAWYAIIDKTAGIGVSIRLKDLDHFEADYKTRR